MITATTPLYEIAFIIGRDWKNVNYAARPYLGAMYALTDMSSTYGADSARSIVLYFLNNASAWRGPVAREIKAELRRRAGAR